MKSGSLGDRGSILSYNQSQHIKSFCQPVNQEVKVKNRTDSISRTVSFDGLEINVGVQFCLRTSIILG